MQPENIIEVLNERIKELTCLYEISNIVALHNDSFEGTLEAIAMALPKAWKYPQYAIATIQLEDKLFRSGNIPDKPVSLESIIEVEGSERGKIYIHYPADKFDQNSFLSEERLLLQKVASEVGGVISRFEQKKRQELMERKMQHNDRLAILGEITAGIAHELNTPLANILGFAQLIQENKADKQLKNDLDKIVNSAIYAREVVKKLMFFACEMPQQMQTVAVNELVENAIKLLRPSLMSSKITIDFKPLPKETMAPLDPIQLTQVVFNLLINAIHATSPGGKISVGLKTVKRWLLLSFADNGKGIPTHILEKIFEPFFTTKPIGEGSGLGLSVVHGIIKSHKGKIEVKSKEGKGTTFLISLPLNR